MVNLQKKSSIFLSVIIPAYNESNNIPEITQRLAKVLEPYGKTFEIILIDDGSTDGTFEVIKELSEKDSRIIGIKFSRNFGQHSATLAGVLHSRGKLIATIDCDMQIAPENITKLMEKIEEGYDVASAARLNRYKGSPMRAIASKIIARLNQSITGMVLKDPVSAFKIYRRDKLAAIYEVAAAQCYYLVTVPSWAGLLITEVDVEQNSRKKGKSRYHYLSLMKLLIDWFYTFSTGKTVFYILFTVGIIGIVIGFFGFIAGLIVILLNVLKTGIFITALSVVAVIFGAEAIALSMLHEKLTVILEQTQKRPKYFICETTAQLHNQGDSSDV